MAQAKLTEAETDIFEWLSKWIESELGIVYAATNRYQLESRLESLLIQKVISSHEELKQRLIKKDQQLIGIVRELATNHETLFFRDPRFFQAVESVLIPKWKDLGKPLRIWSAASSTGQEIYSLSMLIEKTGLRFHVPKIELLVTDVSQEAVDKARAGFYTNFEVTRGLSPDDLKNYFTPSASGSGHNINATLQKDIAFKTLNLLKEKPPMGCFDLILCRNVLIYFSIESRRKVLQTLETSLSPTGILALGAGETLIGIDVKWKTELVSGIPFFSV